MQRKYHDIIRNVSHHPLWWFEGIPRYGPFSPDIVGTFEAALVHTECRECGTRYDVAVCTQPPFYHPLRYVLAYTNSLNVGDPPFACQEFGATCGPGFSMSSVEIRILEFWTRDKIQQDWQRVPSLERPLVDARHDIADPNFTFKPVFLRIYNSEKSDEWRHARDSGDFSEMVRLLKAFDCEHPIEVAHMIDLERRQKLFQLELSKLRDARFKAPS